MSEHSPSSGTDVSSLALKKSNSITNEYKKESKNLKISQKMKKKKKIIEKNSWSLLSKVCVIEVLFYSANKLSRFFISEQFKICITKIVKACLHCRKSLQFDELFEKN